MPRPPRRQPAHRKSADGEGWDPVAAWYDKLVGESGSDYHRHVILPAALRLLDVQSGERVIDVCCGQGVLAKPVLAAGAAHFTGVDASRRLIDAASARHGGGAQVTWLVADACAPDAAWADGSHDAAACLMAVHDVPELAALFANIAGSLKPGGRAVLVFMHPCFRIPRQTHWGWDNEQKIQFRRIDHYATPLDIPITTHPGRQTGEQTIFHHRPLAELLGTLAASGLSLAACEELCSHRRSQASGPFSRAEHRAAAEIPLFMAIMALKS